MKNIRKLVHDVIDERILPWVQRDGISNLILPEQITPADCAKPIKSDAPIGHWEYILGFGLTGKTPYRIDNRIFIFKPGRIVLMPRWTPHGTVQATIRRTEGFDLNQTNLTLWLVPHQFGVMAHIIHDVGSAGVIEAGHPCTLLGRHFDGLTAALLAEVQSRPPNYARVGRAILVEFLERCLQSCDVAETMMGEEIIPPSLKTVENTSKHVSSGRVQAAQDYIHLHYHTPITLEDIADAAGSSTDYLRRLFRASLGITPMQYLLEVRMESAKRLLLTDLKVREVSYMVGIEDHCYFSRVFRRVNGVSPGQYRREITGKP